MISSDSAVTHSDSALNRVNSDAVLAREAGVPFQPPLGNAIAVDPINE